METLKIIGVFLACELIVYYLVTCFIKWNKGEYSREIFNIFYSCKNADKEIEWRKGYQAHKDEIEKTFKKVGWMKENEKLR
jgi:hypothetical protein